MGREDVSVLGRFSDLVFDFFVFSRKRHDAFELHRAVADTSCCSLCIFRFFSCLGCSDTVMPRVAERLCSVPEYPNPESSRASSASTYMLGVFLDRLFVQLFKNGGIHSLPRGE